MPAHAQQGAVKEPLRSILKDELERPLRGGLLFFFSYCRLNFSDIHVDNGIILINLFGIVLESPDDVTGLVFVAVFDELESY